MQQLAGEGCDKKTISTMASDLMFGGEPENHVSLVVTCKISTTLRVNTKVPKTCDIFPKLAGKVLSGTGSKEFKRKPQEKSAMLVVLH